jgi:alkaline phosphatase D
MQLPASITRRELLRNGSLLAGGGALALAGGSLVWPASMSAAAAQELTGFTPAGPLFRLGVASGDPAPDGIVLWTRLAPDPLSPAPGAGMPPGYAHVDWEIAEDDAFRRVVRRGTERALPEEGHSVHVELHGLRPDRWYWYRFHAFGQTSAVGRARTSPRPELAPGRMSFAFASCQQWRDGFYTAHRALAEEAVDLVVFLGDYIYETSPLGGPRPDLLPPHMIPEPMTLDDYRRRHALYKLDLDLQAAHASCPWICVYDDHELDNNWADEVPQDPTSQPPAQFLARRAAALQAFWENTPLPRRARPRGIDMRCFRRVEWGRLASFHVLDTRQYRSDQVTTVAAADDPARTMLGDEQERWLYSGLRTSDATWNVLANQTFMAMNDRSPGPLDTFDFDNWDGYRASRQRLLDFLGQRRPANPVVITGDRHATWVCDLTTDFENPAAPIVGSEFVGTSVTSGGDADPGLFHLVYDPITAESPHWKYLDNGRGYIRCTLDGARWNADLRVVSTVLAPRAAVATRASFAIDAGRPGVQLA